MEFYDRHENRTGIQEAAPYNDKINVQCDFVMIYGLHDLKNRVKAWKKRGYVIHLMTGVAWGEYQDYLYGKFDGVDHHDEGQMDRNNNEIGHGIDIPYMVPSISFSEYLIAKLKTAVDAGVEAIHMEEPEFWVRGGYSEAFKREWLLYYKEPWQPPHSSCEAQFHASKLKQYLYHRMLDRVCGSLKEYALKKYGRELKFYVPTHSLINYTQWSIVSPESSLIDLPAVDGYIAQIWTGTARSKNNFRGTEKERTFETAYLEYGIMQELVRGTGRKMWFLHDPVEDDPNHTWDDYRYNYYRTVSASLLHPDIYTYEVAPWPSRVFCGKYSSEDNPTPKAMPENYRTNLLIIMNALRDMKQPDIKWHQNKLEIGILLSDSAMFQREYPEGSRRRLNTGHFNPFFGLALPLLKYGAVARPVQLDNIRRFAGYLDKYKILVLSYEYMKPEFPDIHNAIAVWVKNGGILIYSGNGTDEYNSVRHWWNTGDNNYKNPAEHLFESLGFKKDIPAGTYKVGSGILTYMNEDPAEYALSSEKADAYRETVKHTLDGAGINWNYSSSLILERGHYTITANMDETEFSEDKILEGSYIDMYSDDLHIVNDPVLKVGSVGLYYNLSKADRSSTSNILCSAARIEKFRSTSRMCTFTAVSAAESTCLMRIATKTAPASVSAELKHEPVNVSYEYDETSKTLRLSFANSPDGVQIKIKY